MIEGKQVETAVLQITKILQSSSFKGHGERSEREYGFSDYKGCARPLNCIYKELSSVCLK